MEMVRIHRGAQSHHGGVARCSACHASRRLIMAALLGAVLVWLLMKQRLGFYLDLAKPVSIPK